MGKRCTGARRLPRETVSSAEVLFRHPPPCAKLPNSPSCFLAPMLSRELPQGSQLHSRQPSYLTCFAHTSFSKAVCRKDISAG